MDKVLLVSNAYAGSASQRVKEVIVKALAADFKLEVADTSARGHASELSAEAVDLGFDAVVAFGGDGTVNEVAQGLVGTEVALGILPGGSTNVMARSLGLPRDPVEATAVIAHRLLSGTRRRVNVGRVGERYFLFSAGMGLDAEVVRRVEADPVGKRKHGEWLWLRHALVVGSKDYRGAAPQITVEVEGAEPQRAVLAICCNGRPFTYFKRFPVDAAPLARLDAGLDLLALKHISTLTIPRLMYSVFVSRRHIRWRSVIYHHDIERARLVADRPLPVQVDGDYIGERTDAPLALVPSALTLLA